MPVYIYNSIMSSKTTQINLNSWLSYFFIHVEQVEVGGLGSQELMTYLLEMCMDAAYSCFAVIIELKEF